MSSNQEQILIIDDCESSLNSIGKYLAEHYKVYSSTSGNEGIDLFKKHTFPVVILDTEMSGMNGFEICKLLKSISPEVQVIFRTAKDDEEIILKCFEAGANDFIPKHKSLSVVLQVVRNLNLLSQDTQRQKKNIKKLTQTVEISMIQASLYGDCLNFMSDIQTINSFEDLGKAVLKFFLNHDFNSAIEFHHADDISGFSQETIRCSPLEKKVFSLLKDRGRIYEFGSRAIFNDTNVSILIKNMPDKHSTKYGLWIDIFAKLIPAIEMRYRALFNYIQLNKMKVKLEKTVIDINEDINHLKDIKEKMIDDVILEITLNFHNLDLSDNDEKFLENAIEKTSNIDALSNISQVLITTIDELEIEELKTEGEYKSTEDIELF
ncbi:response regulator [Colwellia piezophila]|uniref:response regulator n=1 Tax=Colwellia piezophila TaxID=211668 RepID=UPI00037EB9C8|nr:response regulator [Colwellia piezophila]